MNPFNAIAAVLDALKTHPEPVSLPDALVDVEPLALAEARSRLQQIAQVATELRRLIDRELAEQLDGKTLRYGEDIVRPSFRGAPKIPDPELWWNFIETVLETYVDPGERGSFLQALYPASSVRLGGLKRIAELTGQSEQSIKETFIHYDPPTSPLSVMPMSKAPKYLQDLEEGEIR